MLSRRALVIGAALAAPGFTKPAKSTLVLTFDCYVEAYTVAMPIMASRGVPGTFFVNPSTIGQSGQATVGNLHEMQKNGWEIGIYLQGAPYMVSLSPGTAWEKLRSSNQKLRDIGINVRSVAPNSRKWNKQLADMARKLWTCVRANPDVENLQTYPIADPLWIKHGGAPSWGPDDTAETLRKHINRVVGTDGLLIEVIHSISLTEGGLFVHRDAFEAAIEYVSGLRTQNKLRVCTMAEALTPP